MANASEVVEPTPQIEEVPTPQISGEQGGQQTQQAGGQSVDLAAIKEELREEMRKELQSMKDTRLGKYGTRLDNLEEALSKYASLTGTKVDPKALEKMQADQTLAEVLEKVEQLGQAPSQPSAGTGGKPWVERQASILEQAGIAKDDRRLSDLLKSRKFSNYDEYLKVLEEKSFEWMQADAGKPQPSQSTIAPTAPSVPIGSGTYTKDKYKTDMLAARGKPDELRRIKEAARKDGVDVDNIGFI